MSSLDAAGTLPHSAKIQGRRSVWAWPVLVGALVVSGAFFLFARTVADPDLWGHLRFGWDLWNTRQLIRSDTYSYLTVGSPWVNHEWLAELVFYLLYVTAGPTGMVIVKAAVGALVAGLGYRHLVRREVRPALAGLLTMLAAGLLRSELATVRPQLFTHLLTALLLLLMYEVEMGHLRWLWAAPVIFAVWANSHGGYLAGAGLVFVWAAVHLGLALMRWCRGRGRPLARELAGPGLLLASVAATLANPYGLELWAFLLRTATVPRPEITEWAPLSIMSVEGIGYLVLLALAVAGLAYSRRTRHPALVVVLACAAFLPLTAQRHAGLFAIAALLFAGEHIGDAAARWLGSRRAAEGLPQRSAPSRLMAGTCLAACVVFLGLAVPSLAGIRIEPVRVMPYPVRAVALLRESGVVGNLAVEFGWGEYVLWHLGPSVKVSVDGRRETVYPDRVYEENLRFMSGLGEWDALLGQGTQMALVGKSWPSYNLMRLQPGWTKVYEDPLCGLFVREGSPLADCIRQTAPPDLPYDGAGQSFP